MDRAYVMADPSMDKQELYVAASRSREQTYLYATPEIQIEREEFAPRSPHLREGLDHIAEAAERDGAQASAHDEALRSRLQSLSTEGWSLGAQSLSAAVSTWIDRGLKRGSSGARKGCVRSSAKSSVTSTKSPPERKTYVSRESYA